jgi:ADP-heptose:LPS heptosyltransferase
MTTAGRNIPLARCRAGLGQTVYEALRAEWLGLGGPEKTGEDLDAIEAICQGCPHLADCGSCRVWGVNCAQLAELQLYAQTSCPDDPPRWWTSIEEPPAELEVQIELDGRAVKPGDTVDLGAALDQEHLARGPHRDRAPRPSPKACAGGCRRPAGECSPPAKQPKRIEVIEEPTTGRRLILRCTLCPGDVLTLTAAVESLHRTYPGEYLTDVRTSTPAIWENNPWITRIEDKAGESVKMEYKSIHRSNQTPAVFLRGYTEHLAEVIERPLELKTNRPHLYLADDEREWVDQVRQQCDPGAGRAVPFWIVNAGVKSDYPLKGWPIEHFQRVVDGTRGVIRWVQIGSIEKKHTHPDLAGVLDLRGKTSHRELIRLVWHCQGALGPPTYLQHLAAAWEKPYLCLLGSREPVAWVTYPKQHVFHSVGLLPCCTGGACWKGRVVPGDGGTLCERPVLGLQRPAGECLAMIQPEEVLGVLERIRRALGCGS